MNNQKNPFSGNIKLIQDVKIFQQLFDMVGDKFGGNGDNGKGHIFNFFIVQAGNTIQTDKPKLVNDRQNEKITKQMLYHWIEEIPQPRLKNILLIIHNIALEGRRNHKEAAKWLGITRRQLEYALKNQNESVEIIGESIIDD